MDFALTDEHRMLKDLVARFVREELMPLEPAVLERETAGQGVFLTVAERAPLDKQSRELGLWGLDAPEDVGGSDLPEVALVGVNVKESWARPCIICRTCFPRIRRTFRAC